MFWNKERFTEKDMADAWIAGFTSCMMTESIEKLKLKIKDEAILEAINRLNPKEKNAANKK